jgi:hypothetical protein
MISCLQNISEVLKLLIRSGLSKVYHLNFSIALNQYVLWFEISMRHLLPLMKIGECLRHLKEYLIKLFFRETSPHESLLLDLIMQVAMPRDFHTTTEVAIWIIISAKDFINSPNVLMRERHDSFKLVKRFFVKPRFSFFHHFDQFELACDLIQDREHYSLATFAKLVLKTKISPSSLP